MASSHVQVHREALQRQTQQDWANREYIELIAGSIKVWLQYHVDATYWLFPIL